MRLRILTAVGALSALLGGSAAWAAQEGTDAVQLAQKKFADAKARGVDMAPGPCLGELKPGWVADVAHVPRTAVDDQPENQCADYRSGKARHFVELDPDGRLIRAK